MPSTKAATKRAAPEPATSTETKQQKATENDELDDLFANAELSASQTIVNKTTTNAAADGAPLDSTLKMNKSLGWYGGFESFDKVKAWWKARPNERFDALAENWTAWNYFTFLCLMRKRFLKAKLQYETTRKDEDEWAYISSILAMFTPRGAPHNYAQAKWVVDTDPDYAFEFIHGSFTTLARMSNAYYTDSDMPLAVRQLAQNMFVVVGSMSGDTNTVRRADFPCFLGARIVPHERPSSKDT